jgi:uncharacterized protein YjiS (DUF1127 family)
MRPAHTISTSFALATRVVRVVDGFVRTLNRVREAWAHRRAVAELAALDAHQLRDIGLSRADVLWAMETPLREDPTMHLARLVRERRAAHMAAVRQARKVWR